MGPLTGPDGAQKDPKLTNFGEDSVQVLPSWCEGELNEELGERSWKVVQKLEDRVSLVIRLKDRFLFALIFQLNTVCMCTRDRVSR